MIPKTYKKTVTVTFNADQMPQLNISVTFMMCEGWPELTLVTQSIKAMKEYLGKNITDVIIHKS